MPGQQPKLKRQLPLNQNTGREILSGIFFSLIFKKINGRRKKEKKPCRHCQRLRGFFSSLVITESSLENTAKAFSKTNAWRTAGSCGPS